MWSESKNRYTVQSSRKSEFLKLILKYFVSFLNENICCDSSLEYLDEADLIMDHNTHFSDIIWKSIPFTPSYLEQWAQLFKASLA